MLLSGFHGTAGMIIAWLVFVTTPGLLSLFFRRKGIRLKTHFEYTLTCRNRAQRNRITVVLKEEIRGARHPESLMSDLV